MRIHLPSNGSVRADVKLAFPPRRRSRTLAASAVLACAVLAHPAAAQQRSVAVGTAVDSASGLPVRAARVTVDGVARGATKEDGTFVLSRLVPGVHYAAVQRLGYEDAFVTFTAAGDTTRLTVRLVPEPLRLAALTAVADRLERRRLSSGFPSQRADAEDLAGRVGNATQFVFDHFGMAPAFCPQPARRGRGFSSMGAMNCLRSRGDVMSPCVLLNEMPIQGLAQLAGYQPSDLYRIEVYKHGSIIMAYTPEFVESMAKRKLVPTPVEALDNAYCRGTAGSPGS
ncbi:MAG TPA: carboxypeptidase-like regulatory domain-containing protein [Longimicrobiaceae bacterium]|jgi:hypothetical protein|nr:carboxypeptidase-like regulatory domain-containing protein [Longimicrobiaceae bacterium]